MKKGALFALLFFLSSASASQAGDSGTSATLSDKLMSVGAKLGDTALDDGKYLVGSVFADIGNTVKAPLEGDGIVSKKGTATGALLLGTVPATIYGLDNRIRRNVRNMNDGTASALQNAGLGMTLGSLGILYGWGLYSGNEEARHVVLTGVEAMGLLSLTGLGVKAAFGRRRPSAGDGPLAFFKCAVAHS